MIRLHHVPFSRSFRVLWLLEELGLDYDLRSYRISDGSLRSADYLAQVPMGRVPALEMDGQVLTESGAICQVLAARAGRLGRLPADPDWGAWLEWISFAETMANQVEQLNLQLIFLRPPARPSEVVVKLNRGRLRRTLEVMEQRLGAGPWLLGDAFSVADVMMGFNVFAAPLYVPLGDFPGLLTYQHRIAARPAYQRARARDGAHEFELPEGNDG